MTTWKEAFSAINMALGVVQSLADVPGVKLIPHVDTIASAASALQAGLQAGINVAPYVEAVVSTYNGALPTAEDRDALKRKIEELESLVDAPLPPREEGEPE
jgi:hypothetical protein